MTLKQLQIRLEYLMTYYPHLADKEIAIRDPEGSDKNYKIHGAEARKTKRGLRKPNMAFIYADIEEDY